MAENLDRWLDNFRHELGEPLIPLRLFEHIDLSGLSKRTGFALYQAKIIYYGDLITKTEKEMLKEKNIGIVSLNELKEHIEPLLIQFGTQLPNWPRIGHPLRDKLLLRTMTERQQTFFPKRPKKRNVQSSQDIVEIFKNEGIAVSVFRRAIERSPSFAKAARGILAEYGYK